jgi:hypothetical protein
VRPTLVARASPDGAKQLQLAVAAYERRQRERTLGRFARRLYRQPRGDGVGLALRHQRPELLVSDHVPRRPLRLRADDDAAGRRARLEARGGVHDIASRQGTPGACVLDGHDRLARIYGGPSGKVEAALLVQLLDALEDA